MTNAVVFLLDVDSPLFDDDRVIHDRPAHIPSKDTQ